MLEQLQACIIFAFYTQNCLISLNFIIKFVLDRFRTADRFFKDEIPQNSESFKATVTQPCGNNVRVQPNGASFYFPYLITVVLMTYFDRAS